MAITFFLISFVGFQSNSRRGEHSYYHFSRVHSSLFRIITRLFAAVRILVYFPHLTLLAVLSFQCECRYVEPKLSFVICHKFVSYSRNHYSCIINDATSYNFHSLYFPLCVFNVILDTVYLPFSSFLSSAISHYLSLLFACLQW